MANSDNVVRAGLTPKFRDKTTLCEILAYSPKPPREQVFQPKPHPVLPGIMLYDPPTPEFTIALIKINEEISIPAIAGPSIFLVIEGSGNITATDDKVDYKVGEVLFVPAMNTIKIMPTIPTLIFQAFCACEQ